MSLEKKQKKNMIKGSMSMTKKTSTLKKIERMV